MAEWTRVKWSEAGQVLDILGQANAAADAAATQPPSDYFDQLRERGELAAAVKFLSQALPRLEAVAWAARTVRDLTPANADTATPEARALRAALLWVSDPTETRRRAAQEAAAAADVTSPEQLAAMATFFSGGSIAPVNCAPVPTTRDSAGRFAAVAVICAAARTANTVESLNLALDSGVRIACEGLESATA